MCIAPSGNVPAPPPTPKAPSKREKTAIDLSRPEDQQRRQLLAARLGIQQLRAPLVNPA